jgi:hypothetical protein
MKASVGDRIILRGGPHEPVKDGEIIEAARPDGAPGRCNGPTAAGRA